ncbi:hypothetical protein H310_12394 [Aphanomyces invadans]|uniref:Uncharacterized protein n=1 Tax=Aphanomyces invadans TaxID=157072 RepID=A0A024THF1_9STRA|nr:hypothetical protein H310_12394 [Aphanomyces invadans]ETV93600.1 hypothetical protein H310_12394 [Aphanomyces invadans]|eukprot:XP_008877641.1 hypothetical protein H310_12394 [Aphanomyces invadans]
MCYSVPEPASVRCRAAAPQPNPQRKRHTSHISNLLRRALENVGGPTAVDTAVVASLALKIERLLHRCCHDADVAAEWPLEVLEMKMRQLIVSILRAKTTASLAPNNYTLDTVPSR